jgi:hypothetical protein
MADQQQLQQASDELHARYSWNFAGFPRGTRDTSELDELIRATAALISQADALGDEDLVASLRERRKLYQRERREILAVQNAHEHAVKASFIFLDVRARHHFYMRNFAGEERASRDLDGLKEALQEVGTIHGELKELIGSTAEAPLASYAEEAERVRSMFQSEIEAIEQSRRDLSADAAVSASARAANTLFARYRNNFSGLPRISRRPALIDRLIKSLEAIHQWMESIEEPGESDETLQQNLNIVVQQLSTWQAEREEIRNARANADFNELVRSLEMEHDDASAIYREEFAGKGRAGRDLERLDAVCCRLDEVERMCRTQLGLHDVPALEHLLRQTRSTRFRFCREYDAIREAQENPKPLDDSLN